ncbi:MAG: AAA family ATPase [Pseudomonadota bacterium]
MNNRADTHGTTHADAPETQADVIAFLTDPRSYRGRLHPDPVEHVETIETHGARIFLAGDRAYKLKRAVKLSYLDFSTLERRERACRHELERNHGFAPSIYIGVEPIVRTTNGNLAIGGEGDVLDWVVIMHRFDQQQLLNNLASHNALEHRHINDLAATIASVHAHARTRETAHYDEHIERVVSSLCSAMRARPDVIDPIRLKAYEAATRSALENNRDLLNTRGRNGHVRLCHGDLHLQNIVLLDDHPTLFDAIEFDDTIATIDVLYDLAFLIMDLWHRKLHHHANACLSGYAARAMDRDALAGLALLGLFVSARAGVRAMVGLDRLKTSTGANRNDTVAEVRSYFELAAKALHPKPPVLIAIGGLSGSGKSTIARGLAPSVGSIPGALHLRSDVERKIMLGKPPLDPLPPSAYGQDTTDAVYARLGDRALAALKTGHSIIVDATFLEASRRLAIEEIAKSLNIPFRGLWLNAPHKTLLERVEARTGDASDADQSVVKRQIKTTAEPGAWTPIDAVAHVEVVLQRVRQTLLETPDLSPSLEKD